MRGNAFCPAHITGFFTADFDAKNQKTELQGSLGAGFSIQNGVTTTVQLKPTEKQTKFQINVSGYQPDNKRVSEFVINEFLKIPNLKNYFIDVHHDIEVPVGYGLGCSGAVALSLAFALDQAFGTNFPKTKLGHMAHNAEVSCKTGLGDVIAAYHGGFEIRTKAGAPGIGKVKRIDTDSLSVIMICFSPISTTKFMTEQLEYINGLGGKMVKRLEASKDFNDFQDMSLEFARYIEVMTPKMNKVIDDLKNNGIKCGVALFGETIFALVSQSKEDKVREILNKYDGIVIKSEIDNVGARRSQ